MHHPFPQESRSWNYEEIQKHNPYDYGFYFSVIFDLMLRELFGNIKTVCEKFIHNFSDSDYLSNQRWKMCKNLKATHLFFDFFKVFDSIHGRKN